MGKDMLKELFNMFDGVLSDEEIKTTDLLTKIASRITKCRLERNMTQKEFAQLLGISQAMVSKMESENYNFSIETLSKICCKLGLDLDIKIASEEEKAADRKNYSFNIASQSIEKDTLYRDLVTKKRVVTKYNLAN